MDVVNITNDRNDFIYVFRDMFTEYNDNFICSHVFRLKNHIPPLSDFNSE
jgi:hypothetical protein